MHKRGRETDGDDEGHGIRLPGQLLEQIQNKQDKGEYNEDDDRFSKFGITIDKGKKNKPLSRKEQRLQLRKAKKQKRGSHREVSNSRQDGAKQPPSADLKSKKTSNQPRQSAGGLRVVKEDDLDDEMSEFSDFADGISDAADDSDDVQDPLAQLKALKDAKNAKKSKDDPLAQLKALKDAKNAKKFKDDPLAQLKALKDAKNAKNGQKGDIQSEFRIVKEDDLQDEVSELSDEGFDESEQSDDDFGDREDSSIATYPQDPIAELKAIKQSKNSKKTEKKSEFRIVKESDLEDEISDDFDEEALLENDDEMNSDGGLEYLEDPLAQLKALKEAKKAKQSLEDPMAQLKAIKEAKNQAKKDLEKKSQKSKRKDEAVEYALPPGDDEYMDRDDLDMAFYAKQLGLKGGKNASMRKEDDDDEIGGLLEGIGLDFSDHNSDSEKDMADSYSESDSFLDSDFGDRKVAENPYVAPVESVKSSNADAGGENGPTKYIPPAMRRKMALESAGDSPDTTILRRSVKGPLNKLSEANFSSIVNEINGLFLNNARHLTNSVLTGVVLESIVQQGRLLDTFVNLHAALVAALYRLQGADFGAYFIQTMIEKFEDYQQDTSKGKEASNLVSLLSALYQFSLISSKLLYDIIKSLINNLDEANADLLLRLIRNSGNQMRSDDPSALKEIVLLLNKVYSLLGESQKTTRTQFLIETISSLKNNKLKSHNEGNQQLNIRLKIALGAISSSKLSDPIQVTLDDIRNINTRGKWWLVGSAWKGQAEGGSEGGDDVDRIAINDVLDHSEPNWMELARLQRMNTDIRRAIFISIMSAGDYIDAVTKLDKLSLKRAQEREIPRVLMHCTKIEPAWNPYYGILAHKLCDNHNHRKTFQFMLWDMIKELEGSEKSGDDDFSTLDGDEDEEAKLKRVLNLGRFFGFLIAQGSLPLHVLRTVNMLTASSDTNLFLEVLFISFLDQVALKSKIGAIGAGLSKKARRMHEQKFEDKLMIERIAKSRKESTLLKGIQHFLRNNVADSGIISNSAQKKRILWGVDTFDDLVAELISRED